MQGERADEEEDEQEALLGQELDDYLATLESGSGGDAFGDQSSDFKALRRLVEELHCVASLMIAGRNDTAIPKRIGKYLVRRKLGEGGQSQTWLAQDKELQRLVVLKIYRDLHSEETKKRVLFEGRALSRLSGPYTARCVDVGEHSGVPFLIMEYIAGTPLDRYLADQRLTLDDVTALIIGISTGLHDVHQAGLIHRDLKSANIIIGNDRRPRIVDFGLAHDSAAPAEHASGTPAYMAPEQARGESERIDVRTDVFGVGAIFYELLTGDPPFRGDNREESLRLARVGHVIDPRERNARIPKSLSRICMQCLAAEPADRIQSAIELNRLLSGWRNQQRLRRMSPGFLIVIVLSALTWTLYSNRFEGKDDRIVARAEASQPALSNRSDRHRPESAFAFFTFGGEVRHDFDVDVKLLGARSVEQGVVQLVEGDTISFRIQPERDCFVTIISYGDGPPIQLFPLFPIESIEASRVAADESQVFPAPQNSGSGTHIPIRATRSLGSEAVCILASLQPISLGTSVDGGRFLVFETELERNKLRDILRGMIRQPKSVDHAVSQIIIPYHVQAAR